MNNSLNDAKFVLNKMTNLTGKILVDEIYITRVWKFFIQ